MNKIPSDIPTDIPKGFYRTSVKALILNDQTRFLLTKESNGMWELPGGGLDYGESHKVCLNREISEEMGLKVIKIAENPSYFFTFFSAKSIPFANVVYEVEVENLDFTPSKECTEVRFFTNEEASKVPIYGNIEDFIELFDPKNHQTA